MKGGDGVRMLYATDGSAGAAVALDLICALSLRPVDEVIVVSHPAFLILARPNEGVVGRAMERRRQRARDVVEAALGRLRARGARARGTMQDGEDTVDAILRAAEENEADLIIVGSRGLGPLTSILVGSTARTLAMLSPVPVLVVRDRLAAPRRVLVAFDGSSASRSAVEISGRLPLPADATVELLNVLPARVWSELGPGMNGELAGLREEVERDDERQGADRLREATAMIEGVTVRTHLECGPVAETILGRASAIGADLVVLGSRGASGPRRPFWGSTAERVLVSARCPVLVAPSPATADIPAKPRAEAVPA